MSVFKKAISKKIEEKELSLFKEHLKQDDNVHLIELT